jgi:hypothetical protein
MKSLENFIRKTGIPLTAMNQQPVICNALREG